MRRGRPSWVVLRAAPELDAASGGLAREAFIANILKCRPPGNRDLGPMKSPLPAVSCATGGARRPAVILAVGRIAAQNLLGTDARSRLRGTVHRFGDAGTRSSSPTTPPICARRAKRKAWDDLACRASPMVARQMICHTAVQLRPMAEEDLARVSAVERESYSFPWSEGIFGTACVWAMCAGRRDRLRPRRLWGDEHRQAKRTSSICACGGDARSRHRQNALAPAPRSRRRSGRRGRVPQCGLRTSRRSVSTSRSASCRWACAGLLPGGGGREMPRCCGSAAPTGSLICYRSAAAAASSPSPPSSRSMS